MRVLLAGEIRIWLTVLSSISVDTISVARHPSSIPLPSPSSPNARSFAPADSLKCCVEEAKVVEGQKVVVEARPIRNGSDTFLALPAD